LNQSNPETEKTKEMCVADILAQLQPLFREVLDQPHLNITRQSTASSVEGWDSLAHMNLLVAIEQEFGVSFTLAELEGMKSVGDMVDLIEKKSAKA
jgi:acyl carrier protein